MRLLVFVTDAYGGRGGIAKFNRDMLSALCAHEGITEVVALPRVVVEAVGAMPQKLSFRAEAARGKLAYLRSFGSVIGNPIAGAASDSTACGGVLCGHIHLLPLAYLAAKRLGVPLMLVVHGVEAWEPTKHRLANRLARRVDYFVTVSEFTKRRLMKWTGLNDRQGHVIPNLVDLSQFGMGPKRPDLLKRYGLLGKTVILTLGRLAGAERYKGFDEIIELLPELSKEIPDIRYVIGGDGPDRRRLEAKATRLAVRDRVVFTGYIDETEKADHYRLADAYVMPGRGEGFGIVYLEALACGIPVIASTADASREAVRDGLLGQVVDPDQPQAIKEAIHRALSSKRQVFTELEYFSTERFRERWYRTLDASLQLPYSLAFAASGVN